MLKAVFTALFLALTLSVPASAQSVHMAVIVGLAGDPEHGELFNKWAGSLVQASTERFGIARERVVYLAPEAPKEGPAPTGRSTREAITQAFGSLAQQASKDDMVFV